MARRSKPVPAPGVTVPSEVLSQYDWMPPREQKLAVAEHVAEEAYRQAKRRARTPSARRELERSYERQMLALAFPPLLVNYLGDERELCCTQSSLWQTLVHARSAPFADGLKKLATVKDPLLAAEATKHLVWLARDADLPAAVRAAKSLNPRSAGAAFRGAELATIHHHASRRFSAAFIPLATAVVTGERALRPGVGEAWDEVFEHAIDCLKACDPVAARKLLPSPRCIHPGNRAIRHVLWSLYHDRDRGRRYTVPAAADLWSVDEALAKKKLRTTDNEQARSLILTFTAERDPHRTKELARARIASAAKDEYQRVELAKEALRRCKGFLEPEQLLARLNRNPAAFSSKAAGVLRAYELALSVQGDGLTLTLANGCPWPTAVEGLRTIGLTAAAKALHTAAHAFGPGGLPTELRNSMRVYEALSDAQHKKLARLDDAFTRHADRALTAAPTYISAHFDQFRPKRPARRRG